MKFPSIYLNIILLIIFTPILIFCEPATYKVPVISIPTAGNSWVSNDVSLSGKIITSSGIINWADFSGLK